MGKLCESSFAEVNKAKSQKELVVQLRSKGHCGHEWKRNMFLQLYSMDFAQPI
jgi:hypothetical protein